MNAPRQLKIDNYLEWLKNITAEISTYKELNKRLARLEVAINYLDKRWTGNSIIGAAMYGLGEPKAETSRLLWEHFIEERNRLTERIEAFDLDNREGLSLLYFESNQFYIPSFNDWVWLDECRNEAFSSLKSGFDNLLKRSVISRQEQIKKEWEKTFAVIENSPFYNNAISGHPIFNSIISDLQSGNGLWASFIDWVLYVDWTNWLEAELNEAQPQPEKPTESEEKDKTYAGIALYYYYLSEFGGEDGLYNTETLNNALELFKIKSKKNLQNHRDFLSKNARDITLVSKKSSRIEKDEKLKRLRFAYTSLKEKTKNQKAIARALQDLRQVEAKVNGNVKALI